MKRVRPHRNNQKVDAAAYSIRPAGRGVISVQCSTHNFKTLITSRLTRGDCLIEIRLYTELRSHAEIFTVKSSINIMATSLYLESTWGNNKRRRRLE